MTDYPPPPARGLNAQPLELEGRTLIVVQDPMGLSPEPAVMPIKAYFVLTHLNGKLSIREIQEAYQRQVGELLFTEEIEQVIRELDERLFLDSPRFQAALKEARSKFASCNHRPASHAGQSYPADPDELRRALDQILALADLSPVEGLTGLVAPHIDFTRGAGVYAAAYQALPREKDRLFVLLGTAHTFLAERYVVCDKDFLTPLGQAKTDKGLAGRLAGLDEGRFCRDILVHKSEHSLEFQVVFLQQLLGPEVRILPILCGGLAEVAQGGPSPKQNEAGQLFLGCLKEIVAEEGAVVVIGADLAHVGPQFGGSRPLNRSDLITLKQEDEVLLEKAVAFDAEGFFDCVAAEKDRRNICGLAPIYAGMRVLPKSEGRLLGYDQWVDEQGMGSVTFAAIAYSRSEAR